MTLKDIRENVEAIIAIPNRAALEDAVKILVEGQNRVAQLVATCKAVAKVLAKLSDKCATYVLAHPTCVDDGKLDRSPIGVLSGNLTVDGETYHFVSGYGTPVRQSGEPLTQEYLSTLPDGWAKAKLALDTTAIMAKLGKGKELTAALTKQGLIRPAKNQWSVSNGASDGDDVVE